MEYNEVKELIQIFETTDLNEMELTLDNVSLRLDRGRGSSKSHSTKTPVFTQHDGDTAPSETASHTTGTAPTSQSMVEEIPVEGAFITAPIVGTFYASAAPDKPAFVKAGDAITAGDVTCIIEAMKFMNEVPSTISGTVAEVLVEDGQFVEYGQKLFRIV